MQVTKRQEANCRERQRKTTGEPRGWGLGQRIGTYCTSEKKKIKNKSPVLSSPVSLSLSLSGLVEEDVSRLRVFWDVWGKPVKLLDRLGVDFLHNTRKSLITDNKKNTPANVQTNESGNIEQASTGWDWEWRTSTMSSSNSSQKPWLFTMVM